MLLGQTLVRLRYALSARYRRQRFQVFWERVGRASEYGWWLDLGGGPGSYFLSHALAGTHVVLLDIDSQVLQSAREQYPQVQCIVADGQNLPFKTDAFACLFCNSVIEHVPDPQALASEIRRTAKRFFVQTPNGEFPLESHSAIPLPFYRIFPPRWQRWMCELAGSSFEYISSVSYLPLADLARLFPDAETEQERVLGVCKSYFVVGGPRREKG